mmetsp:Transcript_110562/g.323493  ORF Transcript_110562/g.323493 Transcript_110562/m.323493 type:complete len:239 (-) Transcript_110562:236-952(-)
MLQRTKGPTKLIQLSSIFASLPSSQRSKKRLGTVGKMVWGHRLPSVNTVKGQEAIGSFLYPLSFIIWLLLAMTSGILESDELPTIREKRPFTKATYIMVKIFLPTRMSGCAWLLSRSKAMDRFSQKMLSQQASKGTKQQKSAKTQAGGFACMWSMQPATKRCKSSSLQEPSGRFWVTMVNWHAKSTAMSPSWSQSETSRQSSRKRCTALAELPAREPGSGTGTCSTPSGTYSANSGSA